MDLSIEIIKNHPIDSNCFVLYNTTDSNCIVVDPGTEDCKELLFFLSQKKLFPKFIILTHEHFDHNWGVNKLLEMFDSTLVCSQKCLELIADKKKNLSLFQDQKGFEIVSKKTKVVSDGIVDLEGFMLEFKITLGHSLGSVSCWIDNNIFVGDVLIKDTKTVTKLPGGCKGQLKNNLIDLKELFCQRNMVVYPGHGDIFRFDDIDFSKVI